MNDMTKIVKIKEVLNDVYLDWVSNFETIEAFADWYGVDKNEARAIIDMGRQIHEKYFANEENKSKK